MNTVYFQIYTIKAAKTRPFCAGMRAVKFSPLRLKYFIIRDILLKNT